MESKEGQGGGCKDCDEEVQGVMERIEVGLEDLAGKLKEVVSKGVAQRVIVQNDKGETLLNLPLFLGAAAGVASIAYAPIITAVVAVVGLAKNYKIIIETKPEKPAE